MLDICDCFPILIKHTGCEQLKHRGQCCALRLHPPERPVIPLVSCWWCSLTILMNVLDSCSSFVIRRWSVGFHVLSLPPPETLSPETFGLLSFFSCLTFPYSQVLLGLQCPSIDRDLCFCV